MRRFDDLADDLDEITLHLRLEGNDWQANQYRKASSALRTAPFIPPDPSELNDIGETIRDDIAEYRAFGEIERLEDMRDKRPYLAPLTRVAGLGPKTAETLYEEKGIETIDDLIEILDDESIEEVSGIGPKTATKFRRSSKQLNR